MRSKAYWLGFLMVILPGLALAQNQVVTPTGADFLKLGAMARANALGLSYTAISEDAASIYWNPAGLAFCKADAYFMHSAMVKDIPDDSYDVLATAFRVGPLGIGVGGIRYSIGEIQKTNELGEPIGTELLYDAAGVLGAAFGIGNSNLKLGIGAGVKGIHRKFIEESTGNGFGADLGAIARAKIGMGIGDVEVSAGAAIQNLGPDVKIKGKGSDEAELLPLPRTMRAGVAIALKGFLATAETRKTLDEPSGYGLGIEYDLARGMASISLRAGYRKEPGEISGWTFGGGIYLIIPYGTKRIRFGVDYARVPGGDLGAQDYLAVRIY